MNDPMTQLVAALLALLAYTLILATLRTLGARVSLSTTRHDLVVASKQRRLDFLLESQAEMQSELDDQAGEEEIIYADVAADQSAAELRPAA